MAALTSIGLSADAVIGFAPAGPWSGAALSVDADVTTVVQIGHWTGHQLEPCAIEGEWDRDAGKPLVVNVLGWYDAAAGAIADVYKA